MSGLFHTVAAGKLHVSEHGRLDAVPYGMLSRRVTCLQLYSGTHIATACLLAQLTIVLPAQVWPLCSVLRVALLPPQW